MTQRRPADFQHRRPGAHESQTAVELVVTYARENEGRKGEGGKRRAITELWGLRQDSKDNSVVTTPP